MTNRKDEKRKNALKKRRDIETLEFQVQWGLKKLLGDAYYTYTASMEAELHFIIELNLYEDLLSIKEFVDDVRGALGVEPEPESGDFCHCLTAMALGIGKTNDICNFDEPTDWQALLEKKILSIYYPAETRNKIFEYAKAKKLQHLYISGAANCKILSAVYQIGKKEIKTELSTPNSVFIIALKYKLTISAR